VNRFTLRTGMLIGLALGVVALGADLGSPGYAQFLEPDVHVLYSLAGETAGDNFGFVGERIGDLNGDGASEFLIGAPRGGVQLAGKAYIYSGRDGALLHIVTGNPFNRIGFSVAGVGDVNKDGVPDYAVGGPGTRGGPFPQIGRVLVLSGADHSVLFVATGTNHLDFFGYDINAAGDANGDGSSDVIVGAPFFTGSALFSGRVHLISGHDGSTLWIQEGQQAQAQLGTGVSGIADVDGDGLPEQAIGARGAGPKNQGEAYVLSGRTGAYLRTLKPVTSSAFGLGDFFVHDAGDVDGDGRSDIYVGDYGDTRLGPFTGRAYIYSGATSDKLRIFNGENAGDGFGCGRGVPDVDGDGAADVVSAAYTSSAGANQAGKTYLLSGKTGKTIRTMTGTTAGQQLGIDALPIGDVNADGKTDFLITGAGVAHVVAGN
jgi:hypothetical protein